jgi:ketopantoate reductase
MRVLVVGAGALGGYFGGRLVEAGRGVGIDCCSGEGLTASR